MGALLALPPPAFLFFSSYLQDLIFKVRDNNGRDHLESKINDILGKKS